MAPLTCRSRSAHAQSVFDQLQPEEMRRARSRSNPFESIKGVFFLNRAAMKMANMDARFDFMFTKPTYPDGVSTDGGVASAKYRVSDTLGENGRVASVLVHFLK